MYRLSVTETFSAAHQLNGYAGACKNLHGHNWLVKVTIDCQALDEIGMALDFGIIKHILREIIETMDHQFLNALPQFTHLNPTSEHIARLIFEQMQQKLDNAICHISSVEISESEKSSVVYSNA